MKEKKIYKVTYNNKEYLCNNISAVRDLVEKLDIPIKPYQLWKLPKEIGMVTTLYNADIVAVPMYLHENPNKGQYKRTE